MAEMSELELLERRLAREKRARREAEMLLEEKSTALFEAKKTLSPPAPEESNTFKF